MKQNNGKCGEVEEQLNIYVIRKLRHRRPSIAHQWTQFTALHSEILYAIDQFGAGIRDVQNVQATSAEPEEDISRQHSRTNK